MDQYTIPRIFGKDIGIIIEGKNGIQFQYSENFNGNALPISPLLLPYDPQRIYTLHDAMAFNGLPGIFNDSLPDRFGSMLMNQYFIKKYGSLGRLSVVDKLLYINTQGMGAIEYYPLNDDINTDGIELRKYISEVRGIIEGRSEEVISELTRHPSPGGARPKAAIMWDRKNDTMSVGNHSLEAKLGNEAWIVKFDEEKKEDTLIEYRYMTAAKKAGISVPPIEIINIGDENHFAIKRFDREDDGNKLHLATLSGLLNLDFNQHASTSYEACMKTSLALTKDHRAIKEIFRRMVFNVIGKNCDDHSKNTSFIMNEKGEWKLSPAYDLVYNNGHATFGQHRMYIAGKIDNITVNDLAQSGYSMGLEASFMKHTIEEVSDLFSGMETNLLMQGVSRKAAHKIGHNICQFSVDNFPSPLRKDAKRGSRKRGMDNLTKKILEKSISKKEEQDKLYALIITKDNQKLITSALFNENIEINNLGIPSKGNPNFKIIEYEPVLKEGLIVLVDESGSLTYDEQMKEINLLTIMPQEVTVKNIGKVTVYPIVKPEIKSTLDQKQTTAPIRERKTNLKPK